MFIRTAIIPSIALAALVAGPAPGAAQDAAAVLQEVQKGIGKEMPRSLKITAAGSGYKTAGETRQHYRIESHVQDVDPTSPGAYWTTPLGFLAGATSRPATVARETLFGTPYQVVTFAAPTGQQVRGYVTEKNVLERTRTEVQDGARKVQVETVFFDWVDFDGLKYPSVIIHRENDQVSRILVVSKVEPGGAPRAPSE